MALSMNAIQLMIQQQDGSFRTDATRNVAEHAPCLNVQLLINASKNSKKKK